MSTFSFFFKHLKYYPTPITLNYLWSFGSLLGIFLGLQIRTGLWLSLYYIPNRDLAFLSIEVIMRDIPNGWFIRYLHSNGASFLFLFLYIHIRRGLYYRSYLKSRTLVWLSGLRLLLLMIITSFLGYVLPWGQMSFWAATVITNLVTVIPVFGFDLAEWLWGGFTITTVTLNRFFTLHYLLPFRISRLSILHLKFVHDRGSTNPLGDVHEGTDYITFYPYFFLKDLSVFFIALAGLFRVVCFRPNRLSHPDNYIFANSIVTPTHIVPEWYFLFFYRVLRRIPNKTMGILFLIGTLVMLVHIVILHNSIQKSLFQSPIVSVRHKFFFYLFVRHFIIISWLGAQPLEYPYTNVIRFYIGSYFIIRGFGYLLINIIENRIFQNNAEK